MSSRFIRGDDSRMSRASLCLLLCLLSACASVQPLYFHALNRSVPPGESRALEYDAANALSLDLYPAQGLPAGRRAPVVVFFYGGTWQEGERGYYRFVGDALSRRGVLVLVPDYRKAPAHPFPEFMQDAASAAAWAKAHAAEYGGDPARIHLMGHSAGAHMAALLGTDARYLAARGLRPRDFASVIGLAGPYDFLPIRERKVQRVFPDRTRWPETQPVNFVDGDEPPFLLLHGGSDRRVWESNSVRMAELLRAAGVPVTLKIEPRTGHIALVNGFLSPRFSTALDDTMAWIDGGEAAAVAAQAGAGAAKTRTASPGKAPPLLQ
jgi:acetyl esterase/lipase